MFQKTVPRVSAMPRSKPGLEKAWQGKPAARTSFLGTLTGLSSGVVRLISVLMTERWPVGQGTTQFRCDVSRASRSISET